MTVMSANLSVDFFQRLKNFKEMEVATSEVKTRMEIAEKERVLSEELQLLQEKADQSIVAAKAEADAYVRKEIQDTKRSAQLEADKLVGSARIEAENIVTKKLDKVELGNIIEELLLAEFKEI